MPELGFSFTVTEGSQADLRQRSAMSLFWFTVVMRRLTDEVRHGLGLRCLRKIYDITCILHFGKADLLLFFIPVSMAAVLKVVRMRVSCCLSSKDLAENFE